ncbi:hypothetical protein O23A_p2912 [Aeromonas salmonicida]|nr:hypothetical protein O23A_p2912 [Aeromonas salmonicida]
MKYRPSLELFECSQEGLRIKYDDIDAEFVVVTGSALNL